MTKFIFTIVLFFLPLIIVVTAIEVFIRTNANTFNLKAKHLSECKDLKILILGSSHNQNALNPEFLGDDVANAAYGSQDLHIDFLITEKAFLENKKPDVIVAEIAYHTLLRENPKNYWRAGLYECFYDIDFNNGNKLGKYILTSSNLKFFQQYMLEKLLKPGSSDVVNKFGFIENDFKGIFMNRNYDSAKIFIDASKRLNSRVSQLANIDVIKRNLSYLKKIDSLCQQNNTKLILVTPPVYGSHLQLHNARYVKLRDNAVDELKSKNPLLIWYNYESSNSFKVTDFKNDDHLNSNGAKKFTSIIRIQMSRNRVTTF
jgi:hypothetical protein